MGIFIKGAKIVVQRRPADTLPGALSACKSVLPAEADPVWCQVRGGRMGIGTCHPPLCPMIIPIVGIKTLARYCRHHEIPCAPGQP